jgi:hypothetical protein
MSKPSPSPHKKDINKHGAKEVHQEIFLQAIQTVTASIVPM